jgi:hypothetical protein
MPAAGRAVASALIGGCRENPSEIKCINAPPNNIDQIGDFSSRIGTATGITTIFELLLPPSRRRANHAHLPDSHRSSRQPSLAAAPGV